MGRPGRAGDELIDPDGEPEAADQQHADEGGEHHGEQQKDAQLRAFLQLLVCTRRHGRTGASD
jgi:hypothetical protein